MPWYDDLNDPDNDPQANFEDSVVKYILRRSNATDKTQSLIDANEGKERLTLYHLREVLHFPLWLEAVRPGGLPTLEIDLLQRPTRTQVFKEFARAKEETPEELSCRFTGVVFPWAHVSRYNVFHDRMPPHLGMSGRWYRIGPKQTLFLLEPLDSLLMSIGPASSW
jgi:hypothetical protein